MSRILQLPVVAEPRRCALARAKLVSTLTLLGLSKPDVIEVCEGFAKRASGGGGPGARLVPAGELSGGETADMPFAASNACRRV